MNDYTSGFMFVDLFETHICNEVYNRTEYDFFQLQSILKRVTILKIIEYQ